jgi:hypothetical protein
MHACMQVKAWCYYESRLLGAHHGLISTYALETLVLYIFNMYHSRLTNPLEVWLGGWAGLVEKGEVSELVGSMCVLHRNQPGYRAY